MKGYAGKILRLNLTERKISVIDTSAYEQWGGGHGMGSAIFFDLVEDKAIGAFDPRNVVTLMTSPLTGTLAPSTSRTEVQGIGAQQYPIEWFTRSNFGGRFSPMLKFAGWDGIVIEGKADKPVWIDIRDEKVQIRDASSLWGRDTYETQKLIRREISGREMSGEWGDPVSSKNERRTTQKPAILAIGPAGENLIRVATLVHDAGNGAGQGGFGGVWGSKNLKAISVIGTGSIEVADPSALMAARSWIVKNYQYNPDNPKKQPPNPNVPYYRFITYAPGQGVFMPIEGGSRPQGCTGCPWPCRRRTESGSGNEASCGESLWLFPSNESPANFAKGADLLQKIGINSYEMGFLKGYLRELYKMGALGPGKDIECDLPFDKFGTLEFGEALVNSITFRKGIGRDLADGMCRAAEKWGRWEKDYHIGLLRIVGWGCWEEYDSRLEVEWGYGSILGDRATNEHCLNFDVFWMPTIAAMAGEEPLMSAEKLVETIANKLVPYQDPAMLDYSEEGIYAEGKVKMISWHRHYTRFWKQSILYCDWMFPDFVNANTPDLEGCSPEMETRFFNAVTGKNMTFEDGLQIGRKIWNLDRAIWALQGRHRDMEIFPDWVYDDPTPELSEFMPTGVPYYLPVKEDGKWIYGTNENRALDREKFEGWKTAYYQFEGWDSGTGWPTRNTLESLGLKKVADELEKKMKLGRG